MDVILQHICNRSIPIDCETVLYSDRIRLSKRTDFKTVIGIKAIDCSFSKPLDLLVSDTAMNNEHFISHMYLCKKDEFEYLNIQKVRLH